MYRSVLILYLACFGLYLLFTRQPDYFDGETTPATIHYVKDTAIGIDVPRAYYNTGLKNYAIDARYVFRNWEEGDKLEVIYETAQPDKAAVYRFWGYWITWEELIASIVLLFVLFRIAVSVTSNPSAESLVEQLDYKPEKKRKYIE